MLEDHWENAGLGWDFWCLLGAGPENGGKKFLLGTGAGIWKNSTGPTLVYMASKAGPVPQKMYCSTVPVFQNFPSTSPKNPSTTAVFPVFAKKLKLFPLTSDLFEEQLMQSAYNFVPSVR